MSELREIPIDSIDPSPWQPRIEFAPLNEIEAPEDIKLPLLVRPTARGRYELVDGEARLRRLQELGAQTVRCEVRSMTDREAAVSAYRINEERKPYEEKEKARWLARFMKSFGVNQVEAARAAHIDQGSISRLLEIARLSGEFSSEYGSTISNGETRNKSLTSNKLKIIASLPKEKRRDVIRMVEKKSVSTADTKVLAAKVKGGKNPEKALVEIENWKESHRQEAHQDKRRSAGKKAPAHRNYGLCEECGDQPYFIHVGPGKHEFFEERLSTDETKAVVSQAQSDKPAEGVVTSS